MTKSENNFARPTLATDNLDLYRNNFFIASHENKESYFSLGSKNFIKIKTPVPNKEFKLKAVYDVTQHIKLSFKNMKAILVHISDGTEDSGMDNSKKFFIDEEVSFNDIKSVSNCTPVNFTANDNDWIIVFVLNNNKTICEESLQNFLPNEGGGGVIIKNP